MSDDGMGDDGSISPDKRKRVGLMSNMDEHVFWSGTEIDKLIDCWSRNAEAVNLSRNEKIMGEIAEYIGTNKNAKQVRAKLKKMRCRYIQEKEKLEEGKGTPKWRYFLKLNKFGHKIIKNPNRKPRENEPGAIEMRNPRTHIQTIREGRLGGNAPLPPFSLTPTNELPPIFPFDPEVPPDVVIDPIWTSWNATLPYAMTDSGLRTLMRSGFRDVSHLELLKRKTANVAMLNLNYHDKLALEHALENDSGRAQQYQVITNDDGTVIEVRGCSSENEEALLITAEGVKLSAWNKSLPNPLTDLALIKLLKTGFMSPSDVTSLITEEEIDDLDLSMRDKAALRKLVLISSNPE